MNTQRTAFIALFLVACILPTGFAGAATSVGATTCATIDSNWKEYNQQILGASKKVSDVVLNACAAIGGGCTFHSGKRSVEGNDKAGGAKNSQHLYGTAIDLSVPNGKEVQFMTLAICGLRRVNNCQGGLGYYRSKSIHVDTRTRSSAVWSNGYRRVNIAGNVSDPSARSVLYGFGDGKCTDGSIQGDYTDQNLYGPPIKYQPPAGIPSNIIQYPQVDATTAYASLIGQQIGYGITRMFQSNTTGQSTLGATNIVYSDTTDTDGTDRLPLESDLLGDDSARTQDLLNSFLSSPSEDDQPQEVVPRGEDNPTEDIGCTDGFLGSGLFKKCESTTQASEDGVATTIEFRDAEEGGVVEGVLSHVFGGTNFTFDAAGDVQRVSTSGGGVDIFYGVHTPTDKREYQNIQAGSGLPNFSQFVSGETRAVTREVPAVVADSIHFVEISTRLGAYYGLIHGVSPLVIGSAPRTFVRMVQSVAY